MPQTATDGIEYLGPNDPADIAGGTKMVATTTQAAIEDRHSRLPYAFASGRVTIDPIPDEPTSGHVDFPQGRFSVPPIVIPTARGGQPGSHVIDVTVTNVTATGCDVMLYRDNDTSTGCDWIAVQMEPASSAG